LTLDGQIHAMKKGEKSLMMFDEFPFSKKILYHKFDYTELELGGLRWKN